MIKRLFAKKIDSVAIAALLVGFSSFISRLLGLLRDRILAGQFGAGDELDVYYAAFRVPDLLYNLLVLGALSAGFIPLFSHLFKEEEGENNTEAWRLASNIINILFGGLLIVGIIGVVFAPQIIKLITPGFSPEKIALTAQLSRVMFLSPLLLGMSAVLGGMLQSAKRFFVYSLSPIFYNIGIIIGALYFVPQMGVQGLAWGVVLGSFVHFAIQTPSIYLLGFRWRPYFELKNKNVQDLFKMMIARTMSLAISQFDLLVTTAIASVLVGGSLSIFNLANNLQSFPVGVFGISFAIAVFPTLSVYAFNRKKLIEQFSRTLRQTMFFIIPASALFIVLRAQLVRAALGSGHFDWQDTILTMDTLLMFALSFFAQATIPLLTRVFYARHNSKTPFYVGLFSVAIDIVGAWFFGHWYGVSGLALAFSISSFFNMIFLWIILRKEIGSLDEKRIFISVARFALAALAATSAAQIIKIMAEHLINTNTLLGILTQGSLAGLGALFIYILSCYLLGSEELFNFLQSIKNRFFYKKISPEDQSEARGI